MAPTKKTPANADKATRSKTSKETQADIYKMLQRLSEKVDLLEANAQGTSGLTTPVGLGTGAAKTAVPMTTDVTDSAPAGANTTSTEPGTGAAITTVPITISAPAAASALTGVNSSSTTVTEPGARSTTINEPSTSLSAPALSSLEAAPAQFNTGDSYYCKALPVGFHISEETRNAIKAGKYVEFSKLIDSDSNNESSLPITVETPEGFSIQYPPSHMRKSKNVIPWQKWPLAWNTFITVSLEVGIPPKTVMAMGKHCETVLNLQATGMDWRYYDETFRKAVAHQPPLAAWGIVHGDIKSTARNRKDSMVPQASSRGQPRAKNPQSYMKVPVGYCRRFHQSKDCMHWRNPEKCSYSHMCFLCNVSAHSASNCTASGQQSFRGPRGGPGPRLPTTAAPHPATKPLPKKH